ncbi:MAG: hypothetical protein WCK86_13055, partial [Planctomycetia bacterium]
MFPALKPCGLAENSRWQAKTPSPEISSNAIPPRMAVAENGIRRVERSLAPRSGCGGRCVSRFRWWRGFTTGYFLPALQAETLRRLVGKIPLTGARHLQTADTNPQRQQG